MIVKIDILYLKRNNTFFIMFFFCFIIVVASSFRANAFKSSDICIITEEVCKGHYDKYENYETKCEREKCSGKIDFQCGIDHCSSSPETCEKLRNLQLVFKSLVKSRINENKLHSIKVFLKSIRKCPSEAYEWDINDICLNGKNCYSKQVLPLRYEKVRLIKKIDCLCEKKHSYKCEKDYCAANKKACDTFAASYLNNSTFRINACGNDRRVYKLITF